MNEKNFNSISKFEVPQSWIDEAIALEKTYVKKPFPLLKFSRTMMAVACFVLVCCISVAVYFITDDSSILPEKKPMSTQNQNAVGTIIADESQDDSKTNDRKNETSSLTHDEENVENSEQSTETHPEPSEKPQKPTQKPDSTKPSDNNEETKPQVSPTSPQLPPPKETLPVETDPYWEPETMPTEPVIAPTEPETEPYKPPYVEPTAPTEPTIDTSFYNVEVYALIGENRVAAAKTIYCALYNSNGKLLGDSNLYSSSHLAIKGSTSGGTTYVYYYPYRYINISRSGTYTYVFYNEKGEEMWRNTCYLKANI